LICCQQDISDTSTAERRLAGIGYISDDRHRDSLVLDMGIAENLLLRPAQSTATTQGHLVDKRRKMEEASQVVQEFSIKSHGLHEPMRFLSGGNQQKLVLAREFLGSPKVIIAFQPTRGLDIGATEFVHNQLLAMRSAGCATLLVSTNLEEILLLSDRIAVIHEGSIMDTIENKAVDITRIGLLMAGVHPEGSAL
jgi:simple sugar transport system ATP-binding protein